VKEAKSKLDAPPKPEPAARVPELSAMLTSDAPPLLPPEPLTTSRDRETGTDEVSKSSKDVAVNLASFPNSASSPEAPAPLIPSNSADWAEIRRTMRGLGVSRYGLDGEPGGRVRFHCVIPLAGRRAVGQHFEAEGDDDLQAAQATLRRIALWRATETDSRTP
jgi:hypothetical protein